jgi:hypothetical protein
MHLILFSDFQDWMPSVNQTRHTDTTIRKQTSAFTTTLFDPDDIINKCRLKWYNVTKDLSKLN